MFPFQIQCFYHYKKNHVLQIIIMNHSYIGQLFSIFFTEHDVRSTSCGHGLRTDALSVAMQRVLRNQKYISNKIFIVDPHVANLMATLNQFEVGPVAEMEIANKVFVPIANYNSANNTIVSLHWTLLILEKNTSETDAWFPPIHLDSHMVPGSNSSVNEKMAERMASLIMSGVSSPSKIPKTILYPCCPQQKNLADCGIYAALGLRDAVSMMIGDGIDEENKQLYLAGRKSIFFNEKMELNLKLKWSYDETVATEYRKELHDLMSGSLKKM